MTAIRSATGASRAILLRLTARSSQLEKLTIDADKARTRDALPMKRGARLSTLPRH
jgi:hypothetical protein